MQRARLYFWISVLVLVGFIGTLFVVQNWERTSDISLDLYFVAWHLSNPVPVAPLLLAVFATGLLLGALWGYLKGRSTQMGSAAGGRESHSDDAWA